MKGKVVEFLLIAGFAGLAGGSAYLLLPGGSSPADVDMARMRVQQAEVAAKRVAALPDLPNLQQTWSELNLDWQYCGLKQVEQPQLPADDPSVAGEPPFWTGGISGDARIGLECLSLALQRYPLRLIGLTVNEGKFTARYRLYGLINPEIVTGETS